MAGTTNRAYALGVSMERLKAILDGLRAGIQVRAGRWALAPLSSADSRQRTTSDEEAAR